MLCVVFLSGTLLSTASFFQDPLLETFVPMAVPALEVVFTHVGDRTIDDESTQDGKEWLEAFKAGAESIPAVVRAGWGRSYKDPTIAMHFVGMSLGLFCTNSFRLLTCHNRLSNARGP